MDTRAQILVRGVVQGVGFRPYIFSLARRRALRGQALNVALSGGVFQNRLLARRAGWLLEAAGFEVFTHSRAPANDGGVSLCQAAVAGALIKAGQAGRC